MYMRYAGGGIGHYQVPLNDPHSAESAATEEPDVVKTFPVPTDDVMVGHGTVSLEQLQQEAEAAGTATINDGEGEDADEAHTEELTFDDEEDGDGAGQDDGMGEGAKGDDSEGR